MRRTLLLAVLAACAVPQTALAASVHAYSLGTRQVQVAEWDGSHHAVDVPLKGLIAVPAGSRPAAVIVLEHGSFPNCRVTGGGASPDARYPCPAGHPEIDNAAGLANVAAKLADAGFIALTVNANAAYPMDNAVRYGDGFEASTTGAFDMRAQLIAIHLAALGAASRGGSNRFGVALRNRADLNRVGLAGHSRGGEGVVDEAVRPHAGFRLRAVMLIAPTDFEGATPPDVPLHVVLGSCDGDVWNLAGAGYYDRARLGARVAPISQTLVRGANHNWFSTTWSPGHPWSFDDAPKARGCTGSAVPAARPTPARQQAVLGQLATAFFRRHLAAGPASPLLGDRGLATRIAGVPVVTSYDAPSSSRVDIDRAAQRTMSAFGTSIRAQGLTLGHRRLKTPAIGQAPPHGWSPHDLAVRTIRWRARHGRVTYRLPTPAIRGMRALSLRLAVDTWASAGPAVVDIDLRDRAGHRRTVRVRLSAERPSSGAYRKAVLGTVRVRLARWRGLDLGHLTALVLRPAGRHGAVLLGDVAFTRTI